MKLVTYIENKYQEATLAAHNSPQYALWIDSEVKALHAVLTFLRTLMKWTHIVLFPFGYFAVLFGISKEPRPILLEMAAKQKEAEALKKNLGESEANKVMAIKDAVTPTK